MPTSPPPDARPLLLDYGSGGKAAQRLIREIFITRFSNPILNMLDDAAPLNLQGPIAMSTDAYTVDPIFFPGGDIGSLAVHGTINDVAMLGAWPKYMSASFILEEGLDLALLERIADSMARALAKTGVHLVTGDTKVVPRGAADKIFITTTGVGEIIADPPPSGRGAAPGDAIIVSGHIGNHGLAVLSARSSLPLPGSVRSDSAPLSHLIRHLLTRIPVLHVLRDPTRGGLATTLNEIAIQSGQILHVEEEAVPVLDAVTQGCAVLGVDPLYLANEGKLVCIVPAEHAQATLESLRSFSVGKDAAIIGHVAQPEKKEKPGTVILHTRLGGRRLLPMLEGEQLPRIC